MILKGYNLPYRLAVACLCVGASAQWVFAGSGIKIKQGPTQISPTGDPPCDADEITTFKMVIENTNDVCNEFVKIWTGQKESDPIGAFKFLGFKKTQNGILFDSIQYDDMEDESTETFYFDIKTGKKLHSDGLNSCEFISGRIEIYVCDHDGGCDWGASADDPCRPLICLNSGTDCGEEPGPWLHIATLTGDQTNCPEPDTGTGMISGTVTNANGNPAAGARISVNRVIAGNIGCKGVPDFIRKKTKAKTLPLTERGQYEIGGLLFPPGEYEITARDSGLCASQTVMIPSSGELTVNLTLSFGCP